MAFFFPQEFQRLRHYILPPDLAGKTNLLTIFRSLSIFEESKAAAFSYDGSNLDFWFVDYRTSRFGLGSRLLDVS